MKDELIAYLQANYPIDSKVYRLMQISFYNDYHRSIANNLIFEISKTDFDLCQKFFMNKLCGAVMLSTPQWIRNFDNELSDLLNKSKGYDLLHSYFEVSNVIESRDKFTDLVHGEGYTDSVRNVLKSIINKDLI